MLFLMFVILHDTTDSMCSHCGKYLFGYGVMDHHKDWAMSKNLIDNLLHFYYKFFIVGFQLLFIIIQHDYKYSFKSSAIISLISSAILSAFFSSIFTFFATSIISAISGVLPLPFIVVACSPPIELL